MEIRRAFRLVSKVDGVATLLGHLLLNIKRPEEKTRCIYAGMAHNLRHTFGPNLAYKGTNEQEQQKDVQISTEKNSHQDIRAYRTVSKAALAGMTP